MKHAIISALAAAQLCLTGACQSDDLDAQSKAIGIIVDAAERLCKNIPLYSRSNGTELSVEGKAELNEIVKKVVGAGITVAAKYENEESQGILQAELAAVLKDNTNCKMQVWQDLQAKLVPDMVPKPPTPKLEAPTEPPPLPPPPPRASLTIKWVGPRIDPDRCQSALRDAVAHVAGSLTDTLQQDWRIAAYVRENATAWAKRGETMPDGASWTIRDVPFRTRGNARATNAQLRVVAGLGKDLDHDLSDMTLDRLASAVEVRPTICQVVAPAPELRVTSFCGRNVHDQCRLTSPCMIVGTSRHLLPEGEPVCVIVHVWSGGGDQGERVFSAQATASGWQTSDVSQQLREGDTFSVEVGFAPVSGCDHAMRPSDFTALESTNLRCDQAALR